MAPRLSASCSSRLTSVKSSTHGTALGCEALAVTIMLSPMSLFRPTAHCRFENHLWNQDHFMQCLRSRCSAQRSRQFHLGLLVTPSTFCCSLHRRGPHHVPEEGGSATT